MSTGAQDQVWFAREVFQLFVKAFTNLKLYPHDHAHCQTALNNFATRLRSYVQLHDVLRLRINQAGLFVLDQPVYEEGTRTDNLAFRLFVDGLREISITRGVTTQEAVRLAHAFYKAVVDPSLDATLLLFDADFTHIDYAAINSLSEAWETPDYLSGESLELLDSLNRDVDQIVAAIGKSQKGHSFELTDGAEEAERVSELAGVDRGTDRLEDEDIFSVSPQALEAFGREVDAWGPDRMLRGVVEASLDGLALLPDVIGRENVAWLLREAVEQALRGQNMELLSGLLLRYEGELALLDEEEEAAERASFQDVFLWLAHKENVNRLIDLAHGQSLGGPQAFCRILSLLGENGLAAAVATYLMADSKELKDALLEFVGRNLRLNYRALAPLLEAEQDAVTVRSGLFLLSKQRGLETEQLAELLDMAREHSDPKVSQYATHLWRTMTGEGRKEGLLKGLRSEDRRERLRALQLIVKDGLREAVDAIRQEVDGREFVSRDAQEQLAFITAIRQLGGSTAVGFLQRQSQRATGVFNRRAVLGIREMASDALDRLKRDGGS